ncbi:MAG: zinc-ribbon domain-containing protein [Bacillaceae bacterium]|nr:zinc-ribbon domain-containing protein [Bacillaceae bacterium]
MFCHQCGAKVNEDANYCSNCGANLKEEYMSHEHEDQEAFQDRSSRTKQSKLKTYFPYILPLASLLVFTIFISSYYFHEQNVNAKVIAMQSEAEEYALEGDFDKAKEILQAASDIRPNYHIVKNNIEVIKLMQEYQASFKQLDKKIEEKQYVDAEKLIIQLKDSLPRIDGPLIQKLRSEIEDKEATIKISKIVEELEELTTVAELARKLQVLSSVPSEDGMAVKEQVINRIVQITVEEAEQEIENKQFSRARSVIDRGLQYAVNDDRLLALRERVQSEQEAFELAEQERLDKAIEAAEKEELQNKTAAVELIHLEATLDDFGGLSVAGQIQNVATTGIYSVTITYNILDKEGELIDTRQTTVYPYHISQGEYGKFEDYYFGILEEVEVEIENITWYLD